jgi:hypothetical protein
VQIITAFLIAVYVPKSLAARILQKIVRLLKRFYIIVLPLTREIAGCAGQDE